MDKKASHVGNNFHILRRGDRSIVFDARTLRRRFVNRSQEASALAELSEERAAALGGEKPVKLNRFRIEVTLACNASCKYCIVYQNDIRNLNQHMTMEVAEKIVRRYWEEIPGGSIMIIGGEPLANWPVVKYFLEQIPGEIYVFTNGTLIDEEKARALARPNTTTFVSLDGSMAEDNKLRVMKDGGTTFEGAVRGLRQLKAHGARIGITCVITDNNASRMFEFVDTWVRDFDPVGIGVSYPHYTAFSPVDLDMEQYASELIKTFWLAKEKKVYVDQLAKRLEPLLRQQFRRHACKIVGEQIAFYPDGRETLCIKFDKVMDKPLTVADLERNLPVNNPFCQGCIALGVCGGGCPWDAKMRSKHGVDERECVLNPPLVEMMLWDMYDESLRTPNEEDFFERYRGVAIW